VAPIIARIRRVDANLKTVSFSDPRRPSTLLGTLRRKAHLGPRNPKIQSRCRTRAILIALLDLIGHLRPIFSLQWLVNPRLGGVSISTYSCRLASRRLNGFRVEAPREEIRKHLRAVLPAGHLRGHKRRRQELEVRSQNQQLISRHVPGRRVRCRPRLRNCHPDSDSVSV